MISRYDFMEAGSTKDSVTDSYYPDPLSLNYINFGMSKLPSQRKLSYKDTVFFWATIQEIYGTCELDDIILTLNGVPHKNLLNIGDTIIFPSIEDIQRSFSD